MTPANFLQVLSLFLAIISIGVANNKDLWLYKFGKVSKYLLVLVFSLIQYFLYYDWFRSHDIYIKLFEIEGWPMPSTWAYILSLCIIVYVLFVVIKSDFPSENNEKVIIYYKGLISSETPFLIRCIRANHFDKLHKHLKSLNKDHDNKNQSQNDFPIFAEKEIEQAKQEKVPLEKRLVSEIIFNKSFIVKSIDIERSFFLDIVHVCYNSNIIGIKESVYTYFATLISKREAVLVHELNEMSNFDEKKKPRYRMEDDAEILKLLFADIRFPYNMQVFRVFGEEALRNVELGDSIFKKQVNEWYNEEYESTPAHQFLRFADIFIRELLYYENKEKLDKDGFPYWYYFKLICEELVKNNKSEFKGSYAEKYVEEVVWNIKQWIIVHAELKKDDYVDSLANVLMGIFKIFCEYMSDCSKIYLDKYLDVLFSVDKIEYKDNKDSVKGLVSSICLDVLKNAVEYDSDCKLSLNSVWKDFDKIKYQNSSLIPEINNIMP